MTRLRRPAVLPAVLGLLALAAPLYVWTSALPSKSSFSDVEEVGENRLGTGRLDLAAGSASVTLDADNVAPGDRLDATLTLENQGTLALRFGVTAEVTGPGLASWVSWWVSEPGPAGCASASPGPAPVTIDDGGRAELVAIGQLPVLVPGDSRLLCLGAETSIDAPNSVQNSTVAVVLEVRAEHAVDVDTP